MRACSYIAECSLSYAKIMRGERSSKAGKPCFTGLDIAEPKLILCKDNASERNESLLLHCRVQLILCKIICLTTNV
jgi:hypothetical protein